MMLKKMMAGLLVSAMMCTPAVAQMVKNDPMPNTVYHQKLDFNFQVIGSLKSANAGTQCMMVQHIPEHSFFMSIISRLDSRDLNTDWYVIFSKLNFDPSVKVGNIKATFFKGGRVVNTYVSPIEFMKEKGGFFVKNIPPEFVDDFKNSDQLEIEFEEINVSLTQHLDGSSKAVDDLIGCIDYVERMRTMDGR